MLRELLIKNFAIIDDLNISFEQGLTVLSGETGAGKSIIINAVNLLLGARASARMIRDGCETAELSAFFDIPETSAAARVMRENGYAPEEGLLVRRVIAANDRHRIYINDRMAGIQILSAITADLASISGQHANQGLLREETHLAILDRFGGLLPLVEAVGEQYAALVPLVRHLETLGQKQETQAQAMELFRFQAAEIADAAILPDEDTHLETQRTRLKHAAWLHQAGSSAVEALAGADGAILDTLGRIRKDLEKASTLDAEVSPFLAQLSDHLFGLEDVAANLRSWLGRMDADPGQLDAVESRLDLINRLKRKYGGSLPAVFEKQAEIEAELSVIDHLEEEIAATEARLRDCHQTIAALALDLSEKRKAAAEQLATAVETQLADLNMAGTRFGIDFSPVPGHMRATKWLAVKGCGLSATGLDQAVFMIAPNVGQALKPLSAIASGGELSRVVLALKAILVTGDAVGTVIFDEVDAGIGGATADRVGKKLKALSQTHQVICITHLPQIAGLGDHHYRIKKTVADGQTTTTLEPLAPADRIREIARMIGGETITDTALEHARSLVAANA
ncbi:DNA repair protein RecN [Desulfosarcina sp. OttesenSCG-928-G10]|nr:DNA repair protein RecN [Desulfosarcina sp. OttesenSCG-928-G10]MDL2320882.1 DNA repair protein RecN [Desulfosarcina sp. OttesenSCG-928-B08]